MAIIKLQAFEETTYKEACILASKLLEPNSEAYHKEIQKQSAQQDRSQLMSTINKSKATWIEKEYKKGFDEGLREGYQKVVSDHKITYPCSVCGGELAMKLLMAEKGWHIPPVSNN